MEVAFMMKFLQITLFIQNGSRSAEDPVPAEGAGEAGTVSTINQSGQDSTRKYPPHPLWDGVYQPMLFWVDFKNGLRFKGRKRE
jgi:hypothetical protein